MENREVWYACCGSNINKRYIEGFQNAGEYVVIIDDDYEETIMNLSFDRYHGGEQGV